MLVVEKFTRHKTCPVAIHSGKVLRRVYRSLRLKSAFTFGGVFEEIEWVYPRFGMIGPMIAQK